MSLYRKTYLLTPGPTPIPESVTQALSGPIIHHRTPAFQALFEEVQAGLKGLFQTKQDVLLLASTGTGAMEAALVNLFSPGDEVITLAAGKFGERWTLLARNYGLVAHELRSVPGEGFTADEVQQVVRQNPRAKAILFQASETSTGVALPTQAIARIASEHGMLSVCDAITACGVFELPMDDWGIDVLITGSQKALMLPPGLAMLALSERAWKQNAQARLPRFYFDLARERKGYPKHQTAWTPAISLIQGLRESLRLLHEEGLPQVFRRHAVMAEATRAAVTALGLELLAKSAPSTAVSAVLVPPSAGDGKALVKRMRDHYGVTIVGGQDELESKIIRLSHFGHCGPFDITTAISGLELALADAGYPVVFGTGVGAALQVFNRFNPGVRQ